MGFFFPFSVIFPSFPACQSWFFSSSHSFSLPAGHDCLFPLSHAPLGSIFPLSLFTFPCPRGMMAPFHSPMPRSALFSLFSSSLFPARGACLPLFSLPCPARLCFPSFPLHFSLPAGHDGSFSLSNAPLGSAFPFFLFTFPLPAGHVCLFSHSHAPLGSVFLLFLFTFPCPRGMITSFLTLMPRSALFSLFSSSLFPARGA